MCPHVQHGKSSSEPNLDERKARKRGLRRDRRDGGVELLDVHGLDGVTVAPVEEAHVVARRGGVCEVRALHHRPVPLLVEGIPRLAGLAHAQRLWRVISQVKPHSHGSPVNQQLPQHYYIYYYPSS